MPFLNVINFIYVIYQQFKTWNNTSILTTFILLVYNILQYFKTCDIL